ncbi:MAG: FAD-binding protein [Gammaproteobacteria bacterium]|nr:FAD-binding protein [Gammaproteobacteria bacterium]
MAHRVPPQPHEWITRDRKVRFSFEGEPVAAYPGDTITSALLASDHTLLGRSFKYHRPRGILSAANHDSNVLLQTATRTNVRADVEMPLDGEAYTAVNTHGGLKRDWGQLLEALSPVLPVGFYYKAFFRPRWLFPLWERLIRRASGLGWVSTDFPPTRQATHRVYVDCLVIGGGAAGLAAASALLDHGLTVIVIDENARLGGRLHYSRSEAEASRDWLATTLSRLESAAEAELWTQSVAVGWYSDHEVPVVRADGIHLVTARAIIVATGVIETPAVFRNNDLPGVMLASAAQRLVRRYGVAPFEDGIVLAGNASAYEAAIDLKRDGLRITTILDLDLPTTRGDRAVEAEAEGIRVVGPIKHLEARGSRGQLSSVTYNVNGSAHELACDGLLMSVGWAPAGQLLHQARVRFTYDPQLEQVLPSEFPAGIAAAGRVNGRFGLAARIADGEAAGAKILLYFKQVATVVAPPVASIPQSHSRPWFPHPKGKNFVDFDEDIQLHDFSVAYREGFDNVELMKRYTTNGMGPSQGKHSNLNAARILAELQGRSLAEVGSTTARPFYHPVTMGALAGRRLRPRWDSALNGEHTRAGAEWMDAGLWCRPKFYRGGSDAESRLAEYRAVRERLGIIDVSTLGKFEVIGPDAGQLLALCYTSAVDKAAIGMTRYVLMCDQRGIIVDDGVAARIGEQRFYVTAGSSHAQATYRTLTQVAALCRLNVEVVDITRQLAAINIAGPRVRGLLGAVTSQNLSDTSFPFLGVRDAELCGVPVRMMRVGFVGEVGYEIHLPYTQAVHVWRSLMALGAADAILPFGVETQRQLRLEKGHLIVAQDTDGVTHPFETPLAGLVNFKKPHFLGRAALEMLREAPARSVVGFETDYSALDLPIEECHLVVDGSSILGRVTSVGYSPSLGRTIGLAVVTHDFAIGAQRIAIRLTNGALVNARIVPTAFYDPGNTRQQDAA